MENEVEVYQSSDEYFEKLKQSHALALSNFRRLMHENYSRSDLESVPVVQSESEFRNADLSRDLAVAHPVRQPTLHDESDKSTCLN
jgi:hypothetical protein